MDNDTLILEMLRTIQLRLANNDALTMTVRTEVQHLSRRLDNLIGNSLLTLNSSRNDATDLMRGFRELGDRFMQVERGMGSTAARPAAKAPAKKAPAKKAAKKAAAKSKSASSARKRTPARKGR